MDRVTELLAIGEKLGLTGENLQEYVINIQAEEREERARLREAKAKESEQKFAIQELELTRQKLAMEMDLQVQQGKEAEQEFLRKKELLSLQGPVGADTGMVNLPQVESTKHYTPKLPPFDEEQDDIDAYLTRFELFAKSQKWTDDKWAVGLSALLKGKALSVYSRLGADQALNYKELKDALLKRFEFTEEGFRKRFRSSGAEQSEMVSQFATRISNYLNRWLELAKCPLTYDGLRDIIIREQVLACCNQELSMFLRERSPKSVKELTELADTFVEAHGGVAKPFLFQRSAINTSSLSRKSNYTGQGQKSQLGAQKPQDKGGNLLTGRRNANQNNKGRHCFVCGSPEHLAARCPKKLKSGVGAIAEFYKQKELENASSKGNNSHKWIVKCDDGNNFIAGEHTLDSGVHMPVLKGFLQGKEVKVLRDTGCCGIVVKKQFVTDEHMLDMTQTLRLVDGTERRVPVAVVTIASPYFCGTTNVWCMDSPLYDVIIGNVPGALPPDKPDFNLSTVAAVETRGQKRKAEVKSKLTVPPALKDTVTQDEVKGEQHKDGTLKKLWCLAESGNVKDSNSIRSRFYVSHGLLYRETTDGQERRISQLVVPKSLRETVLNLAHNSIMAGHLGITKTTDKILAEFFWPGCRADIERYCKSCDICQRTVHKGSVRKVPLGDMPIIDRPFDKVAVDIIGPLMPASDRGHRYILTVVDFATRYPEAIALKRIETEDIAEALVEIFSRVGVPREMLSDRGSQFTSEVMREVSRLLSLQQMTTTPYHPAANGLVERFNGTLKQMMKRMCSEQPKDWDKYINPLLFAYREVPQESTGFAPFELIYGHHVRGPLRILRELWTKTIPDPVVKTTYQYVLELKERLENTCKLANESLRSAKFRQAQNYNKSAKVRDMKVGQKVLVLRPMKHNKLQLQWRGPYDIVEKVGDVDYRIKILGKLKTFHANMLKVYQVRECEEVVDEPKKVGVFECANISVIQETHEDSMDGQIDQRGDNPLFLPQLDPTEGVSDVQISDELTIEQRSQVNTLLKQHTEVFTDLPGRTQLAEHDIQTTTEIQVRVKPYPVPFHTKEALKGELDKMLAMDIIEPSDSNYAFPVVLLKKRDGTWRFCIDYRQLNKITIFDAEPMPSPEDLFAKLSGCKYFSKIDLSKGYWQVPLSQNARKKSAFSTPFGLFQFKVMSFGLVNAPSTFSRLMRKLLLGMEKLDNFLDDVLIFTETWFIHLEVLEALFRRLNDANLTARPSKCYLGFRTLECLGHIIGEDTIQPTQEKIDAIKLAPRPSTKRQVRSFMGLANYYRKFIPNFASIAVPITDLTKKGMPNKVEWTEAQENAFILLKKLLTSSPILHLPDMNKNFTLRTDASDTGIGAILLQDWDEQMYPVAYASRKLLPRERRYSVVEKECLALVWGISKFTRYLIACEFNVETDHQPLTCLSNKKVANSRLMRWALLLQPYRMSIKAIPGRDNVGADFLSRVSE